jgi:hypothetical protein
MFRNKLKSKIHSISEDNNEANHNEVNYNIQYEHQVLYGLYYSNKLNDMVLAISFDEVLLYKLRQNKISLDNFKNSWIEPVTVYSIKKKSIVKRIANILSLKCILARNDYATNYQLVPIETIMPKFSLEFYCYDIWNSDNYGYHRTCQSIVIVDSNNISKKELFKINYLLSNIGITFSLNPVNLNIFYPNSIIDYCTYENFVYTLEDLKCRFLTNQILRLNVNYDLDNSVNSV